MSYGEYRRFLVDLAYLKEPVANEFQNGHIHAKETSFLSKRKVVKDT